MKLAHIFAAALMVAGVGVSADASAQRHDGPGQEMRHDRGDRHDMRRGNDRHWGNNDRRHGWNNRRNHCRVVYRHHRRVRVCR